jgi:hypothetical protein
MRVTIIKDDGMAYVDGIALAVDCSSLPDEFHALQWDGTRGELEFKTMNGHRKPNEMISDLAPYQSVIEAWYAAEARKDGAAARPAAKRKGGIDVIA